MFFIQIFVFIGFDFFCLNGSEIAEGEFIVIWVKADDVGHIEGHGVDLPVFIDHDELSSLVVQGPDHGDVVELILL